MAFSAWPFKKLVHNELQKMNYLLYSDGKRLKKDIFKTKMSNNSQMPKLFSQQKSQMLQDGNEKSEYFACKK